MQIAFRFDDGLLPLVGADCSELGEQLVGPAARDAVSLVHGLAANRDEVPSRAPMIVGDQEAGAAAADGRSFLEHLAATATEVTGT